MSLETIAIVGPGRINRGVAQAFLWAGHPVTVVDLKRRDEADCARVEALVRDEIAQGLDMLVRMKRTDKEGADAMHGRLAFVRAEDSAEALGAADIIIEGVPEDLAIKEAVLREISRANGDAIIASGTSTMMADELAAFVDRPERFLNAHFLNPAWLIPLVELSPSAVTDEAVVETMHALLARSGKQPIRCKPSPGYIVPRVQMLAGNEAIRLLQEGVATAEDIDRALRIGFALRFTVLGFLEFADWGGIHMGRFAGDYLASRLKGAHFRAPPIIDEMLAQGASGMYAGRGFFDYEGRDLKAYRDGVTERLLDLIDHVGLFPAAGCAEDEASPAG